MPAAAYVTTPITHSNALGGLVAGVIVGAVIGAAVVATGGAAAIAIVGAACTGASLGGLAGKFLGGFSHVTTGQITQGSPNVRIHGKSAAYCTSATNCSRHPGGSPGPIVAQGSSTVRINGKAAARTGDKGACSFVVGPGSPTVTIGGAPAACAPIRGEVPWYADAALLVLGLAGGGIALALRGLGAAAIAARLGGSVLGGFGGAFGGHWLGGAVFGEGSWQQTALEFAGGYFGGGLGFGAGARAVPGAPRYTGARTIDVRRVDAWDRAEEGYEAIRGQSDDVGAVARNTGWSEARVQRVKDHVFYREHQLDDGMRRFDADPEMHNAWLRMTEGSHTSADLRLLQHEYFESRFEALFRTDYRTAHTATIRSGRTWP